MLLDRKSFGMRNFRLYCVPSGIWTGCGSREPTGVDLAGNVVRKRRDDDIVGWVCQKPGGDVALH
jgi:hypothetical protein